MEHTVPISSLQRWLELAESSGLSREALLLDAGISADVIDTPSGRATPEQMLAVFQAMWEHEPDELFGRGPFPVRRGTAALLARALISSPDLRTVLERLEQYVPVFPGLPPFRLETAGQRTRVVVDTSALDDPNHILNDAMLAVAHRFGSWLTGLRLPLRGLELPYPMPPVPAEFELTFRIRPSYGHACAALELDTQLLSSVVVRTEQDLDAFLARAPIGLIVLFDDEGTLAGQVRVQLSAGFDGGWPTPERIAAHLSMSVQHLRRRLQAERTSITQLREDILRDLAVASLTSGTESVADLSRRLGFSEESAFRRAFRRWTGSPPGAYRR